MKKTKHLLISSALCCALSFFARPLHAVNIGDNFRISEMGSDGDTTYNSTFARIAYNSTDNEYLVVWTGDDDTNPLVDQEFEIFGQLVDVDGNKIGTQFRLSDMGINGSALYGAFDPDVVYNSEDNQYLVVWYGDDNSGSLIDNEFEIYGQLVNANGSEDGSDFRISSMGNDGNTSYSATYPRAAYSSEDNQYLVVWQGDHNAGGVVDNENEIFAQLVNADGSEDGSDFRLSDMGPDGNASYDAQNPSVAYNGTDNQYLVTWWGDDNTAPLVDGEFEIFAQLVNADGSEDGSDFRLSDMGPDGDTNYSATSPQVAYNSSDNQYFVVWFGDDNTAPLVDGEVEIFGQLVDADGSEDGTDFRMSDMGSNGDVSYGAGNTSVSYNSVSNVYLVAWQGDDDTGSLVNNEQEIWAQLIGADGAEEGVDERVSSMGPDGNIGFNAVSPAIAFNSMENGFLVVWHGDDNTAPLVDNENEIFGQFFNNPVDCSLGFYSATGDDGGNREAGCALCEAGSYQNLPGQTECIPCPAGYFQPSEGSIVCFECAPGTVQPETGQASCNDCSAGSYQDESAQLTCDLCAAGTFQNETRAIACSDCNYGTVQPDVGQASCNSCPAGYHQDELGQTECKACVVDTFAAEVGATSCEACAEGFTSDEGASECSEVVDDSGDDDNTDETSAASSGGCQLLPGRKRIGAASGCVLQRDAQFSHSSLVLFGILLGMIGALRLANKF